MDTARLAEIHAACFETPRPWSAVEFDALLASKAVFICQKPDGFIMGRIVADEAELLTIAVLPKAQRNGIGSQLMQAFETQVSDGNVGRVFLEVSAENAAAIALYHKFGFEQAGLRHGYYSTPERKKADALVMVKHQSN
ncbi:ribosomal-protein-alanine N-acetyltransferase [Amylibacter kogurei]|uniref:[Ribosomal protein bS18]-alanine N-acetyltransferase n=1 Tax=Paramylibacter kogurei TaxID=1889778 RepID=A0A2G5K9U9_9RHOB|nr:ribosomal protein S18-alanine N-acetyltransferase [Amylibacter kogurei]PIB25660.1 ribosomal-protein-alanine N-acetyltransferase [Amylibacter kogurei]